MISRIRNRWTTHVNAETYEAMLLEEIYLGIKNRRIPGFRNIQLLHPGVDDELAIVTVMNFRSMESVRTFAGKKYEIAFVPPKARPVRSQFDTASQHHDIRIDAE